MLIVVGVLHGDSGASCWWWYCWMVVVVLGGGCGLRWCFGVGGVGGRGGVGVGEWMLVVVVGVMEWGGM